MRILTTLFQVTFGILMALAFFEVGFRLIPQGKAKRWSDRPSEYFMPQDSVNLQDRSYTDAKPANTFRVVVVGDSFTFGPHMQYDDTFAKRLERWLNLNNSGKRLEVINAGVSGYSTRHEVALVEKAAIQQQADLILLEITLNDAELGPLTAEKQKELYGPPAYFKSALFKYWKSAKFILERLHNSKTHRLYKKYFFDLFENPETFKVFENSLISIAQVSKTTQVPVKAVIFPLFTFPMNDSYPFKSIHEKIHSVLDASGINYLDLFKYYTNIPHERLQVIPIADSHPNEIANRIAAEAIYQWLRSQQAIPADFFAKHSFAKRKDLRGQSIKRKQAQ